MPNITRTVLSNYVIGFDSLFQELENIKDQFSSNYPPHNIIITGDDTRSIEFALAGFQRDDVDITVEDDVLTVSGEPAADEDKIYVHQGIASRSFTKQFSLAEYWEIDSAEFSNGILTILLKQEIPEAKKPKQIEIK